MSRFEIGDPPGSYPETVRLRVGPEPGAGVSFAHDVRDDLWPSYPYEQLPTLRGVPPELFPYEPVPQPFCPRTR